MRFFLSERAYRRAIKAELRKTLPDDASYLMWLYSENADLLREAVAAHEGVSTRYVARDTMLAKPMSRAIRAFAEGMKRTREARA